MRTPNFDNILKILHKSRPERPALFEFVIDQEHLRSISPEVWIPENTPMDGIKNWVHGFRGAGYDFATLPIWLTGMPAFNPSHRREKGASVGMAHGGVIKDRASFEQHHWPDFRSVNYSFLDEIAKWLPEGMKLIVFSPGGVLENMVELCGYEDLCYLLLDDEDLLVEIAEAIGSRLLDFYGTCIRHDVIGAAFVNDDWGFKTQTFLSPDQMRKFVFPWHARIVDTIHQAGKPAILHSCGQLAGLWDEIIDTLKFDAKHSYEDTILPPEEAYRLYGSRIAIMGGIDIDFLCRETPEAVYRRAKALLELTSDHGGYALGSGNSIPHYVPLENFNAVRRAALEA